MTRNVATEAGPGFRSPGSGVVANVAGRLRGLRNGAPSLAVILAALVLWEAVARAGILPQRWSPSASSVFVTLAQQVVTPSFWTAVGETLEGWAVALGLAILVAGPLGLFSGP